MDIDKLTSGPSLRLAIGIMFISIFTQGCKDTFVENLEREKKAALRTRSSEPYLNPPEGTYPAQQLVQIISAKSDDWQCYTTNDSIPACGGTMSCSSGSVGNAAAITTNLTLRAVNCSDSAQQSAVVSGSYVIDTTPPTTPSGLNAPLWGPDQVYLTWNISGDDNTASPQITYELCQGASSGSCGIFSISQSIVGQSSIFVSGLSPLTTYYFRIRAKDKAGNISSVSPEISATTASTGTVNLVNISPTGGTYGSLQNVTLATATTGATICYSTTGVDPSCDALAICSAGSQYGTPVSIGSGTIKARACKTTMVPSSISQQTFVLDQTPPSNISNLRAIASDITVTLYWNNPIDTDFSGVKILRKLGGYPTNISDGTQIYDGNAVMFTDSGLTNDTPYYYTVFAYDAVSNVASGAQASATPSPANAPWAKSSVTGSNLTFLFGVALDVAGNVFTAGRQDGPQTIDYGNGVTAGGVSGQNQLLIKYSSAGIPIWARVPISGSGSQNLSVTTDSSNNAIVAGSMGSNSITYDSGVTVPTATAGTNAVVVKYSTSGTALWARSVTTTGNNSMFYGVATDSSGNIYAVGNQWGTDTYNYGASVSVAGPCSASQNAVIVKYDSSGNALWARSVSGANQSTFFKGVTVDNSGNIYAVGYVGSNAAFTFGLGVSATGFGTSLNPVIVKYDSNGNAIWARTSTGGSTSCNGDLFGVAVDSSGNVYATGYQWSTPSCTYGVGVTIGGPTLGNENPIVLKYSSNGNALWGITATSNAANFRLKSIAIVGTSNVYVAGDQDTTSNYSFSPGVTGAGPSSKNAVWVKFDTNGNALLARSPAAGANISRYNGIAVNSLGHVFAAGSQSGNTSITYDISVAATGSYTGANALLVKYVP